MARLLDSSVSYYSLKIMQSTYWLILSSETTPWAFFFFKYFCRVILMNGRFLSQNNIVRRTLQKSRWTALLLFFGETWQEVESESLTTLGWDGIQCRHIFLIHNTIDTRFVYTIDTRKHFHSVFFLAFLKRGAFMSILLKCKEDCVTQLCYTCYKWNHVKIPTSCTY